MPFLPGLAIVFVGIVGGENTRVEQQVQLILQEHEVKATPLPPITLRSLAHPGRDAREIVRQMHVDGVVGGELVTNQGRVTLRLVVYDADGGLKSLTETSLTGPTLARDAITVLSSNLGDEVTALTVARRIRDKKTPPKPNRPNEARVAPPATTRRS